jgi:autotransporter-associated beta strand protein
MRHVPSFTRTVAATLVRHLFRSRELPRQLFAALLAAAIAVPALAQHAMTGNFNITNAAQVWSLSDASLTGSGYVWTFGDANGLNMAGFTVLNTNDASGFTLDLGGGALTNNGTLSTSRGDNTGSIVVTNVSAVTLNSVSTYESLAGVTKVAGSIGLYGADSGALTVASLTTKKLGNDVSRAGVVTILGFTNVAVSGNIDASAPSIGAGYGGGVFIGATNRPIGGSIVIGGDILTGTANAKAGGVGVSLYCNNAVQVGNITMCPLLWSYGNLNVVHKGAFTSGNIDCRASGGTGCAATLNGGDQSGPCVVNGFIDLTFGNYGLAVTMPSLAISNYSRVAIAGPTITSQYRPASAVDAGNITVAYISGSVTMGDISATNAQASYRGGNVSITTSGGNIAVGVVSLDGNAGSTTNETYDGDLTLSAANGSITVGVIDINKVRNGSFTSANNSTKNYILGPLLNFPTASPSTSLLSANNSSGVIYYNSSIPANQYLGGSSYALGSGNGTLVATNFALGMTAVNWSSTASTDFEPAANWGGTAPSNDTVSSIATFASPSGKAQPALTTNRSVGGLNFTAAGWTLGGANNTLTLGYGGIGNAGNNTIAARLAVPATAGGGLWNIGSGTLDLQGVLSGDGYLEKTGSGTLQLSTNNSFTGQLGVDAGTLSVNAGNALAFAKLFTSGGAVNFVTPAAAVGSLWQDAGAGGGTIYLGNTGVNDCTLTVGADGSTSPNASVLANASGRVGSLVKTGTGILTLKASSSYSGSTTVGASGYSGGGLALADAGQLSGTAALDIGYGAALTLDNTGSANNNDRCKDSASVTLRGGTFSLLGRSGTASSESVGTVTLTNGLNTINVSTGGAAGTATLTLAGLVRGANNGVVNFTGTGLGSSGNNPRILITGQGASSYLGPWAIVAGANWAKYDATYGVTNFAAADYLTTTCTTWTSSSHVLLSQNNVLGSSVSNKTLKLTSSTLGINLNGYVLDVYDGILNTLGSANASLITGASGYLTAGDPSTGGELVYNDLSTAASVMSTISAAIQDNSLSGSAKPVSLTVNGNGLGILKLSSANNTFSGGCTLNGGFIAMGNTANVLGSGPFVIHGGTIGTGVGNANLANSSYTWNGDFTFGHASANNSPLTFNNGPLTIARNVTVTLANQSIILSITNSVANNYDLTLVGGANAYNYGLKFPGSVTGSGRIILGSATTPYTGMLQLSGPNSYTGGTVLNSGYLELGSASALGDVSSVLTINGGLLDTLTTANVTLTTANPQVWNNSFTYNGINNWALSMPGPVTLTTNVTLTVNNGTLTEAGIISGNYGIAKPGAGILVLSGANSFSGGLTVSAGTLKLLNALALPFSTLTLTGGTVTFDSTVVPHTFYLGGLAGTANLGLKDNAGTPNGVALVVGSNNASTVYSGVLSENDSSHKGSLIKVGTGTLALAGANTYTGPTYVSNGVLQVTGSLTSVVTVASGGTLGGSGTINSVVTNQTGSTLAAGGVAGSAPGTLTCSTNLVLQSGVSVNWARSATTNDIIQVNGNLTLGGGNSYSVLVSRFGNTVPFPRGDYTLFKYAGTAPALGTWSASTGSTGWPQPRVVLDDANKRVVLRFAASGTTVLFW